MNDEDDDTSFHMAVNREDRTVRICFEGTVDGVAACLSPGVAENFRAHVASMGPTLN